MRVYTWGCDGAIMWFDVEIETPLWFWAVD